MHKGFITAHSPLSPPEETVSAVGNEACVLPHPQTGPTETATPDSRCGTYGIYSYF